MRSWLLLSLLCVLASCAHRDESAQYQRMIQEQQDQITLLKAACYQSADCVQAVQHQISLYQAHQQAPRPSFWKTFLEAYGNQPSTNWEQPPTYQSGAGLSDNQAQEQYHLIQEIYQNQTQP